MKTNELTGAALDWAVAMAEGLPKAVDSSGFDGPVIVCGWAQSYLPSTDWALGGPIIEREGMTIARRGEHSWSEWGAVLNDFEFDEEGPTPLIAAMRCYVASKLGNEVDIPKELQP